MAITISVLALLMTFYQSYLQRVHNAKSLKPLGQITLDDRYHVIAVRLFNYGLGPLIIDKITFIDGTKSYTSIRECVDLAPRSYTFASMDDLTERVILPNASLTIFEKDISDPAEAEHIKTQLTPILLKIEGRDVYDKKIVVQRNFRWFSRHQSAQNCESN